MILLGLLALFALSDSAPPRPTQFPGFTGIPEGLTREYYGQPQLYGPPRGFYGKPQIYGQPQFYGPSRGFYGQPQQLQQQQSYEKPKTTGVPKPYGQNYFYGQPQYYGQPEVPRVDVADFVKFFGKEFRPLVIDRRFPLWTTPVDPMSGKFDEIPKIFYPIYFPNTSNLTLIRDYVHRLTQGGYTEHVGETTGNTHGKIRLIGYPFYSRFTGYEPVVEITDDSTPVAPIEPVHVEKEVTTEVKPVEKIEEVHAD